VACSRTLCAAPPLATCALPLAEHTRAFLRAEDRGESAARWRDAACGS
jgi:hypothetical protein